MDTKMKDSKPKEKLTAKEVRRCPLCGREAPPYHNSCAHCYIPIPKSSVKKKKNNLQDSRDEREEAKVS